MNHLVESCQTFSPRRGVLPACLLHAFSALLLSIPFPPVGNCQAGNATGDPADPLDSRPAARTGSPLRECRPGAWGHLEYYETALEAPAHLVEAMPVPSRRTVWRFPGMTPEDVLNLFSIAGVSKDLQLEIESNSSWFAEGGSTHVLPSERALIDLLPDSRRQIYAVLSQWRENPFHRNPFLVDSGEAREWLKRADLPGNVLDLIETVSYPHGSEKAFSDVSLILSHLATRTQEMRFLKAITRTRSLIVRIRLNGEQDVGELARYWSLGNQFRDSLPLLESVARHPQVDRLDIAHLLPPLPRMHLYYFPHFSAGYSGQFPGSFWTVFNFFEFWPDETPTIETEILRRLQSDYELVDEPSRLGDALVFLEPETRRLLHGCVFIADDIVYTKNGASMLQPWILARLPDLIRRWSRPETPVIETWRRKQIPEIEGLGSESPGAAAFRLGSPQ